MFSYRDGMRDWFVLGKDDYKTVQNTRTGEVYQIPKDALNPFKDDIDLYNIGKNPKQKSGTYQPDYDGYDPDEPALLREHARLKEGLRRDRRL